MIRFSKREDYGVVLISGLAKNFGKRLTPLSEIAKEHKIPLLFLRNIASDLRKAGLIKAVEGKNGGYTLVKNPQEIQLGEILEILTKKSLFSCCQDTKNNRCCADICPHGLSPRRLANEFFGVIYKKTLAEVVRNA